MSNLFSFFQLLGVKWFVFSFLERIYRLAMAMAIYKYLIKIIIHFSLYEPSLTTVNVSLLNRYCVYVR